MKHFCFCGEVHPLFKAVNTALRSGGNDGVFRGNAGENLLIGGAGSDALFDDS